MEATNIIEKMEMRGIVKRFPGVIANDHVDLDVQAGEILGLLGENGTGKSTLMRSLYGLYQPDEGTIFFNNKPVAMQSPADAIRLGVGMIHQHFMLVDSMTVAENVALGLPSSRGALTDLDRVAERIRQLADQYGLEVDPDAYVRQLAVGQQQRVEIMKAMYRGASLLILDEPTAVLTPQEVNELFITLKQMAAEGHALIFISHKLDEVMNFTNRVVVLRDGRNAGSVLTAESSKRELAEMMVGRTLNYGRDRPRIELGRTRLRLENIQAIGKRGTPALRGVSLEVKAGEILGIAGVSGNGQLELAEVVTGLREVTSGRIFVDDEEITGKSSEEIMKEGVAYVPEERNRDGMIKDFSISENIILRENGDAPFVKRGLFDFKAIARHADELVDKFNIKTPKTETPIKNLSGGNAQKVILARELSRQPRILVAAQPTRGLDVGASEYVRDQIIEQRGSGVATLLFSEDLDEVFALSDRIAVIFHGEIMGIVTGDQVTTEELGLMMAGEKAEQVLQ